MITAVTGIDVDLCSNIKGPVKPMEMMMIAVCLLDSRVPDDHERRFAGLTQMDQETELLLDSRMKEPQA